MKIFTNATENRFFATDNHVKNLHQIEIDSVTDLLSKGVCGISVPLLYQLIKVDDLDELIVSNHTTDDGSDLDAPDTFNFDFLKYMTYAEIVAEALTIGTFAEKCQIIKFVESVVNSDKDTRGEHNARRFYTPDATMLVIGVDYNSETIYVDTEWRQDDDFDYKAK